jgi:hypothetical protein
VDDAIADHLAAFDAARQARALYVETVAMVGLANATRFTGRHGVALAHARSALSNAERAGYRTLAGEALTVAAAARIQMNDISGAIEDAEHALILLRPSGYRLAEARALRVLAAAIGDDHPAEADRYVRLADDIVANARQRDPVIRHDSVNGHDSVARHESGVGEPGDERDVADRVISDIRARQATREPRSA